MLKIAGVLVLGIALFPSQVPQTPVLHHEVSVVLKLIQVYVTDKDGKPVKDLLREDFVLTDNGEVKKITDFERHELRVPEKAPAKEKPVSPRAPAEEKLPSPRTLVEPSSLNRKFFILLDFYRNDLAGINMSKKAARHFIETQLQPTDEIAVLSYTLRKGLTVHEYLTRDHARALTAIDRIRLVPGWGDEKDSESVSALQEIELRASSNKLKELVGTPQTETESERKARLADELTQAAQFNSVLGELAQALRTVEGFKSIIFFSWGFARSFIYNMAPSSPYGTQVMDEYQDMIRKFAASNCQVYAVNSEGSRAFLKGAADRGTAALKELSELSGGKYFYDVAQYENIAQSIQNITSHYYVLGYPISASWDGRYHEVRVKVKRKGCEVYAQSGYYNPKPFGEYTDFEKQLQLVDLAMNERPNTELPTRISVAALACSPSKTDNVLTLAEVPARISLEISGGKTEVVQAIFDSQNQVVEFNRGEVEIKASADQETIYSSTASLPPGKYKYRLVLRNPRTGRAARGESSFEVWEPTETGFVAFPPLLLVPGTRPWFILGGGKTKTAGSGGEVSLISLYPLMPDGVPVAGEILEKTPVVWAVVRCAAPKGSLPSLKADFFIVEAKAKEAIAPDHRLLESKVEGDTGIFLFEVDLGVLSRGEYVLTVVLTDERTGARSSATRMIRIVESGFSRGLNAVS
jgi:VWFA-related protein